MGQAGAVMVWSGHKTEAQTKRENTKNVDASH